MHTRGRRKRPWRLFPLPKAESCCEFEHARARLGMHQMRDLDQVSRIGNRQFLDSLLEAARSGRVAVHLAFPREEASLLQSAEDVRRDCPAYIETFPRLFRRPRALPILAQEQDCLELWNRVDERGDELS